MAIINGTAGADWLPGTAGNDTIHGLGSGDSIWGGSGGTNFLFGDDGDDNIVGGPGIDHMDGGAGSDIASYQLSAGPVTVSLADPSINTGEAAGDTYTSIEAITGSPHGGTYYADNSGRSIQLWGLAGTNYLYGGTGYLVAISGPGDDHMFGASGRGMIDYETAAAGVTASISNPGINTGEAFGDTYSGLFDLAGSSFADTLYGDDNGNNFISLPGNDTMYGLGGSDTFKSNAGADTMYGGAGTDLFIFADDDLASARSGSFDRIGDYNRGNSGQFSANEFDGIDLTQVSSIASAFAQGAAPGSLARLLVDSSNTFSTLEINDGGTWLPFIRLDGIGTSEFVRVVFSASQPFGSTIGTDRGVNLGPHGADWLAAGVGDFNGDGTSDILWRNPSNGQTDEWLLANGAWLRSVELGPHGTDWEVAGIGDFNRDGTSDVLWRNPSTGFTEEWQLGTNGAWMRSVALGPHGTDWEVAGIGDFNRDGTDDVLWRSNSTGFTEEWQLAPSGAWMRSVALGPHGADWQVSGIGDFNGDGTSDVMWRNPTTGQTDEWLLAPNGAWMQSVALGAHGTDWEVAGIGDFNGDGTSDVMWRNPTTGQMDGWLLANGAWAASINPGTMGVSWQPAGVADFDNNGKDDLLWRDASGNATEWLF